MSGSGQGVIQAELSIELGKFLANLNAAQSAIAKYAAGAGQSMKPANDAVDGLGKSMKDFRKDQVQEGRLVGFYVSELTSFAGVSKDAQGAIGGLVQGLTGMATAVGPLAIAWGAFEIVKAVTGWFQAAGKEAEELSKKMFELARASFDATTNLDRALAGKGAKTGTESELDWLQKMRTGAAEWRKEAADLRAASDLGGAKLAENRAAEMEGEFARLGGQAKVTTLLLNSMADATRAASIEAGKAMPLAGPGNELGGARFELDNEAVGVVKAQQKLIASAMDGLIAEVTAKNRKLYEQLAKMQAPETFSKDLGVGLLGGESTQKLAEWQMKQPVFDTSVGDAEAKRLAKQVQDNKDAAMQIQDAWSAVGSGISSVFGSIGNAIGGAAGAFLSQVGAMIAQTIALVIALTFSDSLMMGPYGIFAAIPTAAALLGSLIGMIAGVPSFDVGTLSVPRTGLAMVHAGEAILPAGGPAETYRSGLARMGGQGAGGGNVTVNVRMDIASLDGQSVYRTLTGARDQLARVVREAVRDGVMG